jgi:hypothetical protein
MSVARIREYAESRKLFYFLEFKMLYLLKLPSPAALRASTSPTRGEVKNFNAHASF